MSLSSFCKEEVRCELSEGLIQNIEPITKNQAWLMNKKFVLRWRNRVCVYCDTSFDITEMGFGYNCGCCG